MSSTPAHMHHDETVDTGRILVVDDDTDFAEGMELLLAPEGYEVMLAHNVAEATQAIAGFPADVALIDIRLAGSNGLRLITALKQQRPEMLCVMMTAFASTDTAIEALKEGAYGYLIKPFGRDELLVTLQRCFERLHLEAEKKAADAALRSRNQEMEHLLRQLAKSERQYRSLVDACPICIKEIDLSGKLISMNPAGLAMMGFEDASEARGLEYFELLVPEDRSKVRAIFAQACAGTVCEFESTAILDAGPRPVGCSIAPLLRSDGSVHAVIAITQDITDRKAAEQRLQEENVQLREEIRFAHGFDEIIGEDPEFRRVLEAVKKVAPTDVAVLITGETGTGKELIARAIHRLSNRQENRMVSVNCPSLPGDLIESELFGHEKGAFTGAHSMRKGRFESADGGTIFLDELGELPIHLQSKLLRVLQEGTFERLGGTETLHSNVRVIAATNRNLEQAVAKNEFRADLYYRINHFPIHIPALRDRKNDIPLLAHHFVQKHEQRLGKKIDAISAEMIEQLCMYSWPGNIRELEGTIERALITSSDQSVLRLLTPMVLPVEALATDAVLAGDQSVDLSMAQRSHILNALEEADWVITGKKGAAAALNVPPSTLRSKMKRLGISRETSQSGPTKTTQ